MAPAPAQSAIRIIVIGGSGHIGTFLVPRLVDAGHEVIVASRGMREPYQPHRAWAEVKRVRIDRSTEEAAGTFGDRIAALRPDVVIDLICFTLESAQHLVQALRERDALLLHCGEPRRRILERATTAARATRRGFGVLI